MTERTPQDRAEFEAWMRDGYYANLATTGDFDEQRDRYREIADHMAWCAWRAAREAQPVGVPEYTSAMGEAGEAYIQSLARGVHTLPAMFRWSDLWGAMLAARPEAPAAAPSSTEIGPLANREIMDAIRSAYDRGYNDARNARATPGDGAPGEWVPDCEYFRALASAIVGVAGVWVETGDMPSTLLSPYLDSRVSSPDDLGPAIPGTTVTREWHVPGVGLVRATFEGRKPARRGFPPYWVRDRAELLHPCPEGEEFSPSRGQHTSDRKH